MKYSRQKEEILKLMRSGRLSHPNASEVFLAMKEVLPNIGIATVYRNLNTLADAGLIRRISLSGEGDKFDHRLEDHYHSICNRCGAVFDFDFPESKRIENVLLADYSFEVQQHAYVVRGVCSHCIARTAQNG